MTNSNTVKEQERSELHRAIWQIANDLRGSVDGWDFKQYVLGMLFYRFISENLTNYINADEQRTGNKEFNYASLSDDEVEWIDLERVYKFQYGTGNTIPTIGGEYPVYGSNGMVGTHHEYNSEDSPVIGHIGAYAGIVNWASGKHFVTYNGVICTIKDGINPRFGYHLLKKQNLRELAKDGSQPFVSYGKLNKVQVQVPTPEKQLKIATTLDKFDALVNDISIGLPAELKARRQQYEYYRGKLLTFKKLENER